MREEWIDMDERAGRHDILYLPGVVRYLERSDIHVFLLSTKFTFCTLDLAVLTLGADMRLY